MSSKQEEHAGKMGQRAMKTLQNPTRDDRHGNVRRKAGMKKSPGKQKERQQQVKGTEKTRVRGHSWRTNTGHQGTLRTTGPHRQRWGPESPGLPSAGEKQAEGG